MKLYTIIYNIFICVACRTPPDDSDDSDDSDESTNFIVR